ncbi:MAG: prepilin-type N-terminal cleavage/methylation domain-containing protein [bacterium]
MIRKHYAFTLIELLIVVAIIGILAAIAVPNFLNARMRATIARMETDMKALGDALMMYRIDNKCYWAQEGGNPYTELRRLTTPTSYIATIPEDPFRENSRLYQSTTNNYDYSAFGTGKCTTDWILHGLGPDTDEDIWGAVISPDTPAGFKNALYNPSNGTISSGDVLHTSWFGLSF